MTNIARRGTLATCFLGATLMGSTPAQAQRDTTGSRICAWEGWLPPSTGRARYRAAYAPSREHEDALIASSVASNAQQRDAAIRGLAGASDARAVAAARHAAVDVNAVVREGALRTLGRQGATDAQPILKAAARDTSKHIRQAAVWSMAQLEDAAFRSALVEAASDSSPQVRSEAAWGLAFLPAADVAPVLARLARDPSAPTRVAAVCAIGWRRGIVGDHAFDDADATVRAAAAWARARVDSR